MSERNRLPGGPSNNLVRKVRAHLGRWGIRPTGYGERIWVEAWAWAYRVEQSYDRYGLLGRRRHWPSTWEIASQYVYLLLVEMGQGGTLRLPYRAADHLPKNLLTPTSASVDKLPPAAAPFKLVSPPPATKPVRIENNQQRQKPLLAGLGCIPGQLDLFATDGEPEPSNTKEN